MTPHPKLARAMILGSIFLNIIGFTLIIPIMPSFIERFDASPMTLSFLIAVYAFFSFLSAPLFGSISDRVGRKMPLFWATLGSSVGWLIVAYAPNMLWLFVGRIIDGITAGNLVVAQSALTDISKTPEERVNNLGMIGMLFGVGFLIGPVVGSLLASINMIFPFEAAAFLFFINAIGIYFYLPETAASQHSTEPIEHVWLWTSFKESAKNPHLRHLFLVWGLFIFGLTELQTVMTLFLKSEFAIGEQQSGFVMAFFALFLLINQGILMKKVWLKYFSLPQLFFGSLIASAILQFFFAATSTIVWFLVFGGIASIANALLRPVLFEKCLKAGGLDKTGQINGLISGIMNLASVGAPILGGIALEKHISPVLISAIFLTLAAIAAVFWVRFESDETADKIPNEAF